MTRISFLVPTFNRAAYIGESLAAIRAQMGPDDELLVIDDGSTDGTEAAVSAADVGARYWRQDNAGKSVALNRALAMTDGSYVMICDDDDVLRAGSVAPLLAAIEASGAGFAFGRYSRFRHDEAGARRDMGTGYWPDLSTGSLLRHILEDAFVMQNAALVRRSAYAAVGPFDPAMLRSLDYEMFVRLALAVPAAYVDRYIFDQRKHDGARGPASALHAASKSEHVWQEYDRRIFEKVQRWLPIEGYAALFTGPEADRLQRAALLQRACVNARHDLWPLAIADLEAAATLAPAKPLAAGEVAVAERILAGKHGFPGALAPAILDRLRTLRRTGSGGAIVRAMLSGALWRLRDDNPADARAMRALSAALAGPVGTLALLARRKLGRRPADAVGLVEERRDPPPPLAGRTAELAPA